MSIGDELEVSYPDIHPIPHRGLIYRLAYVPGGVEIHIIHNSKRSGVCVVRLPDFAQGQPVGLRRRPLSPEHAQAIIYRAECQLNHPYNVLSANCEHFTDFCYNGIQGESPTLQKGVLITSMVLLGIAALSGERA